MYSLMTIYRMTLRHGAPGKRYHVVDIEAASLRDAMMQAVNAFPAAMDASADLVEIRVHVEREVLGDSS
jgi:hypothetical protein